MDKPELLRKRDVMRLDAFSDLSKYSHLLIRFIG